MNKPLSSQTVPFLVLLVALFGVGLYVADRDIETDVRTSRQALLPNQTSAQGELTLDYPEDWVAQPSAGGFTFTPNDLDDGEVTNIIAGLSPLGVEATVDQQATNADIDRKEYCLDDLCGVQLYSENERQDKSFGATRSVLLPVEDGRTLVVTLNTDREKVNDYREIFETMVASADVTPFVLTPREIDTAIDLSATTSGGDIASLSHPEDFTATINTDPITVAEITGPNADVTFLVSDVEFVSTQVFGIPEELQSDDPLQLITALTGNLNPTQIVEGATPLAIGEYEGAYLTISGVDQATGTPVITEAAILNIPNSDMVLTYLFNTGEAGFEATRAVTTAMVNSLEFNFDGAAEDASDAGDDATSEGSEEGDAGDEADTDTEDTVDEGSEDTDASDETDTDTEDTTDEGDDTSDAGDDAADEATGDAGDETDTDTEDTTDEGDDTSDAGDDAADEGEVVVAEPLPLGDNFVNEDTGLSVPVPEGFSARGDRNFTYLDQASDSIRLFLGDAQTVADRIGVDAVEENVPEALMTAYANAEAENYDAVSDVAVVDNVAYFDAVRSSSARRFFVADLGDGQYVYIEARGSEANIEQYGATVLTMLADTAVVSESADEATGDAGDETDTDTEDTTDEGDDTSDAGDAEVVVVEPLPLGEAFLNDRTGLSVAVPEGFNARGDANFTYIESGADSIRLLLGTPETVADRLGVDLAEANEDDLAQSLLSAFAVAEADTYDELSEIETIENGAYVDGVRGNTARRFLITDLGDGQYLYIEAKGTTDNIEEYGATVLEMLDTVTIADAETSFVETVDQEPAAPLPINESVTNPLTGLTVGVPEGFSVAVSEEASTLTATGVIMQFKVGNGLVMAEELGIEVETLPENDLAVNLMNTFAEESDADFLTAVISQEDGNVAYIDVTDAENITRYVIVALGDDNYVFGEVTATETEFPTIAATLLELVKTFEV